MGSAICFYKYNISIVETSYSRMTSPGLKFLHPQSPPGACLAKLLLVYVVKDTLTASNTRRQKTVLPQP